MCLNFMRASAAFILQRATVLTLSSPGFWVSGFLCFLVSGFLGFWVSWFLGFWVSWFLSLLVSWFLGFCVSWFLGFSLSTPSEFLVWVLDFKFDPVGFQRLCCFVSGGSSLELLRSSVYIV